MLFEKSSGSGQFVDQHVVSSLRFSRIRSRHGGFKDGSTDAFVVISSNGEIKLGFEWGGGDIPPKEMAPLVGAIFSW